MIQMMSERHCALRARNPGLRRPIGGDRPQAGAMGLEDGAHVPLSDWLDRLAQQINGRFI